MSNFCVNQVVFKHRPDFFTEPGQETTTHLVHELSVHFRDLVLELDFRFVCLCAKEWHELLNRREVGRAEILRTSLVQLFVVVRERALVNGFASSQ